MASTVLTRTQLADGTTVSTAAIRHVGATEDDWTTAYNTVILRGGEVVEAAATGDAEEADRQHLDVLTRVIAGEALIAFGTPLPTA